MFTVVEKKPEKEERPTVIKVGITRAGKDAIKKIAKTWGMKDQEAAGRIYEWFVEQDDIMQRAVMGLLKGLEIEAANLFFERWRKGDDDSNRPVRGAPSIPPKGPARNTPTTPETPQGQSPARGADAKGPKPAR